MVSFKHKFKFYVPGTNGGVVVDKALQEKMTNKVMDDFCTMFGGATVTEATGVYKNQAGRFVREPIVLVESFTDENGFNWHADDVYDLAAEVCGIMGQETVAVEIDGVLELVEAKKVEAPATAAAA